MKHDNFQLICGALILIGVATLIVCFYEFGKL